MEIICNNCSTRYVIDENKLPEHGNVIIKCPNCSGKINTGRNQETASETDVQTTRELQHSEVQKKPEGITANQDIPEEETPEPASSTTMEPANHDDVAAMKKAMEYFPEGTKTALIFCPDLDARHEIEKHLQQSHYEARHVADVNEMANRFRYHQYNMIILHQSGPEPSPQLQEILQYLARLPGAVRRKVIAILIMLGGSQYDEMLAFLKSMDIVISPTELSDLVSIIKRLEEKKVQTYRIFFECFDNSVKT